MFRLHRSMTSALFFGLALIWAGPATAASDTAPPQLVGFSIAPASIDVSASQASFTATVHATDDLSGLDLTSGSRIRVAIKSPSGQQFQGANAPQTGTVLDGIFTMPVTVPRYAEPGTWTITILLRDNVGNLVSLDSAALAAAGFPSTVTVVDTNPDLQAPQITGITFTPAVVDVSNAPATVTADFAITDDVSGVTKNLSGVDFTLQSQGGTQQLFLSWTQLTLVSGTALNGVWRGTFTMPQYARAGTWALTNATVRDAARNQRFYTTQTLSVFGASAQVTVTATPSDTTPPVLTGLTIAPAFVDTALGAATIRGTLSATDDLAGVSFAPLSGFLSPSYLSFRSPSGAQSRGFVTFSPTGVAPTSGTPVNGTWDLDVALPQFSEEGTWNVTAVVKDGALNQRAYSPAQLAALGLPSTITVIKPSLVTDGTVDASGGTVVDSAFGTRASLTIPAGVFAVPTDVAIDVLSSPLGIPLPTGFSTAETYYVNVQLTPQPSFPLAAPGITAVLPLRAYVVPGTSISLFRVDPQTGQLTPSLDVSGSPVVSIVDAGGLTATFVGIARFSTVVGLLPDAVTLPILIKPGDGVATLNLRAKGKIPVAVLSTPTFDATTIDPSTVTFSGASVARTPKGAWMVSSQDVDGDGLPDLIAHIDPSGLLLSVGDTSGEIEGRASDGRLFRGIGAVRVISK